MALGKTESMEVRRQFYPDGSGANEKDSSAPTVEHPYDFSVDWDRTLVSLGAGTAANARRRLHHLHAHPNIGGSKGRVGGFDFAYRNAIVSLIMSRFDILKMPQVLL